MMKDRPTKKADGNSLRRGLACLSCRRRKLKCNGQKPVCSHCSDRNRASECEYDDDKKKSRLQTLKEREELLRHQVHMLEMACDRGASSSSSIAYPDVSEIPSSPSGSSSTGSLASLPYFTPPPEYPIMGACPADPQNPSPSPHQPSFGPGFSYQSLPSELLATLLQSFLSHQTQCCFFTYTDPRRRFSSGSNPSLNPPHPALLGSIYLLGCHFLGPASPCSSLTGPLLQCTLRAVLQAVGSPRPSVDVVQACCLIGQYYYFTGDKVQGYRHAFAAARMATTLGMHQLSRDPDLWAREFFDGDGPFADERANEIAVFWQVFTVDRMWSAAYGLVAAFPDENSTSRRITTPFPGVNGWVDYNECTLACYPTGKTTSFVDLMINPDLQLLAVPTPSMLKSMAAALFDRTSRIRSSSQFNDGTDFLNHQSASAMLQRLQSVVPPFAGRPAWAASPPFLDMDLFAVHTILHVCTMLICPKTGSGDGFGPALDGVLAMMNQLDDADYAFLDPVVAICWNKVANGLLLNLRTFDAICTLTSVQKIRESVERLQRGLKQLSSHLPLAADLERTLRKEIQMEFGQPEESGPIVTPIPVASSFLFEIPSYSY